MKRVLKRSEKVIARRISGLFYYASSKCGIYKIGIVIRKLCDSNKQMFIKMNLTGLHMCAYQEIRFMNEEMVQCHSNSIEETDWLINVESTTLNNSRISSQHEWLW
jgi:hypothetical protein